MIPRVTEDAQMADRSPSSDIGDESGIGSDRGATTGTPRWVYVFGIIALIVVLLFVVLLLVGGGHGPRRHTSSGDAGGWPVATRLAAHSGHR